VCRGDAARGPSSSSAARGPQPFFNSAGARRRRRSYIRRRGRFNRGELLPQSGHRWTRLQTDGGSGPHSLADLPGTHPAHRPTPWKQLQRQQQPAAAAFLPVDGAGLGGRLGFLRPTARGGGAAAGSGRSSSRGSGRTASAAGRRGQAGKAKAGGNAFGGGVGQLRAECRDVAIPSTLCTAQAWLQGLRTARESCQEGERGAEAHAAGGRQADERPSLSG
jgi:hypothetical protein